MLAVPADNPVTVAVLPLPVTVATDALPVVQVPPVAALAKVIVEPMQTEVDPVIAGGAGFTVITALPVSVCEQALKVALTSV